MAWFGRRANGPSHGLSGHASPGQAPSGLPPNIATVLEIFGRYEYDADGSGVDPGRVWQDNVAPLWPLASADPEGFLARLAAVALPAGGWCVYGAAHMGWELLSDQVTRLNDGQALMAASLAFLRTCGVPRQRLRGYELTFWLEHGGQDEPWVFGRPIPTETQAPISPLCPGEVRHVAVLEARPNSKELHVWRQPQGEYAAALKNAWASDDVRTVQSPLHAAATLHELYLGIGNRLQVEPYAVDPELAPYFPVAWPRIDWLPQGSWPRP